MRLTSLHIGNLRCIHNLDVNVRSFTSIVGPNNAGKLTVLRAIAILLNQETPHPNEWRDGVDDDLIVEGVFDDIADWERNAPGVAGIVRDNKIQLRVRATKDDSGKVTSVYEALIPDETIHGWSERWGEMDDAIKALGASIEITNGNDFRSAAKKEALRSEVRDKLSELVTLGEAQWTSENISIKAALQQAIPQAIIVPAVRDATDDAKPASKTTFGQLLDKIVMPAIRESPEYQTLLESVESLTARMSGVGAEQMDVVKGLADEISARLSSIIEARVLITMEKPDAIKFVGGSATLRLDDGIETPIALQGHGVQRALIFALVEALARREAASSESADDAKIRSTVLLFEEPELYIHPHLMRRLRTALKTITDADCWQCVATTHSPFLVEVADDPTSLVIMRRPLPSEPPERSQIDIDPFAGEEEHKKRDRESLRAALDFHPTVCEAFFARRTVLVEGDSELALMTFREQLLELMGRAPDIGRDVTVVSCGGKWTIVPFAKLLSLLGVPFRVIHDTDRKGRTDEELETALHIDPYQANAAIATALGGADRLMVEDTLEDALWNDPPSASSDKPFRVWRRTKELCDADDDLEDLPQLKQIIGFAFGWDA